MSYRTYRTYICIELTLHYLLEAEPNLRVDAAIVSRIAGTKTSESRSRKSIARTTTIRDCPTGLPKFTWFRMFWKFSENVRL